MDEKSSSSNINSPYPWQKSYPDHLEWGHKFEVKPHFQLLDDAIQLYGERPCTYFVGKELSYREIGASVDKVARGLQDLGVKKGDKIGLFLPNSPTYIIFYFGILKAGGVVVNYNPLYTVDELQFQVENSETKMMVTLDLEILFSKCDELMSNGALEKTIVASFTELLPGLKSVLFSLLKSSQLAKVDKSKSAANCIHASSVLDNGGDPTSVDIDPHQDLAVLQYTGGTTGRPKGAMLTHANIYINTMQIADWSSELNKGYEINIGILPFFHVFAMTCVMNFSIVGGAKMVLLPKFELNDALKLMAKTKPTCMPGVPTLYNAIMNAKSVPPAAISSLKFCLSGGAPLPLEVRRGFEKLAGCSLVEGYGLSETSPVLTANVPGGDNPDGSIGIPLQQTILSIRSLEDPEVEMPLGEKGEICATGPQVMLGYWNAPEATEKAFVGEYFRTGDVGYMDERGYSYIVDRLKDLIIVSGYNVYPRRIEDALYEMAEIDEVTVIGIPDDYKGEVPKAFVKLREGMNISVEDIMAFLETKLSKLELPSEIEFRDELPKTMVGKLSKKELRED